MSYYSPDNYDSSSAILNICSKKITSKEEVANLLMKYGVSVTVVDTITIMRDKKRMWQERGCDITIHGLKPELYDALIWTPLKETYDLECAFLHILGRYKGCILNFIRPSACSCRKDKL